MIQKIIRFTGVPILLILIWVSAGCGGGAGGSGGIEEVASDHLVTLIWDPPTTREDGAPLDGQVGYKVYYGSSSGYYTEMVDVGNLTLKSFDLSSPGTYYLAVTAYDASGNESDFSEEVTKVVQ